MCKTQRFTESVTDMMIKSGCRLIKTDYYMYSDAHLISSNKFIVLMNDVSIKSLSFLCEINMKWTFDLQLQDCCPCSGFYIITLAYLM